MSWSAEAVAKAQQEFCERDVVTVRGAFPSAAADEITAALWADAARRLQVVRDDPGTWPGGYWTGFSDLKMLVSALPMPPLVAALDGLLGQGRWSFRGPWELLVSGPERPARPWTLTDRGWHWDGRPGDGCQLFATLSDVAPRSGGTLLVEGSAGLLATWLARLAPDGSRKPRTLWKQFLSSDPFLRKLSSHASGSDGEPEDLLLPDVDENRRLAVREVTGNKGDVVVCRSGILHAAAVHVGRTPRFMAVRHVAVPRDGDVATPVHRRALLP